MLPLTVLFVSASVPPLLKMPPALLDAVLPLTVVFVRVSVPELKTAPPAATLPPDMLKPAMLTLILGSMVKMRKLDPLLRCTVSRFAPGPLMLTL